LVSKTKCGRPDRGLIAYGGGGKAGSKGLFKGKNTEGV